MLKKILSISAFLLIGMSLVAQADVQLRIWHKLGDDNFQMHQSVYNNLGHKASFSRVEYYLSTVSLVHSDGSETAIPDVIELINIEGGQETTLIDLGNHDASDVAKIAFYIGVHPDQNHLDPTSFAADHPLAPQLPTMHWGWAAGYRFIALEGNCGAHLNQAFELHGLEDENFFRVEVENEASVIDGQLLIQIDANYAGALENLDMDAGPLVHGGYGDARIALQNFRDYVFFPASEIVAVNEIEGLNRFDVFPNPIVNGQASVVLESNEAQDYELLLRDALGRLVKNYSVENAFETVDIQVNEPGVYFLQLIQDNQSITKKIIVQ